MAQRLSLAVDAFLIPGFQFAQVDALQLQPRTSSTHSVCEFTPTSHCGGLHGSLMPDKECRHGNMEFPKTKNQGLQYGPPKQQGSAYEDTDKKDTLPQFMDTGNNKRIPVQGLKYVLIPSRRPARFASGLSGPYSGVRSTEVPRRGYVPDSGNGIGCGIQGHPTAFHYPLKTTK